MTGLPMLRFADDCPTLKLKGAACCFERKAQALRTAKLVSRRVLVTAKAALKFETTLASCAMASTQKRDWIDDLEQDLARIDHLAGVRHWPPKPHR